MGAGLSLFTCPHTRAMNEFVAESPTNSWRQPTQALSSGEQTFSCKYHRCVDRKGLDSYEMCLFAKGSRWIKLVNKNLYYDFLQRLET